MSGSVFWLLIRRECSDPRASGFGLTCLGASHRSSAIEPPFGSQTPAKLAPGLFHPPARSSVTFLIGSQFNRWVAETRPELRTKNDQVRPAEMRLA